MKKYLFASLAVAAALTLSAGDVSARTFGLIPHHLGHRHHCDPCQLNAFTPPACCNPCCFNPCGGFNGCAPGGWGQAAWDGCAPGASYAQMPFDYGTMAQNQANYGIPPQAMVPPYGYQPQMTAYGYGPQAPAGMQYQSWAGQMAYNPYYLAAYNRGLNYGYGGMPAMNPQAAAGLGGR
jgi:hypothetical protein